MRKQIRVTVEFVEVNHNYEVVQTRHAMETKFGAIATESMGPPEYIAQQMSDLVYERISTAFPEFLKETP